MVWISDHKKAVLKKAKTWYLEVHSSLSENPSNSSTPYMPSFVLMSGRKFVDYRSIFIILKEKIGELSVEVVMDFEKASWRAALLEFPDVRWQVFTFHWTRAVWKNVQRLGQQPAYQNDPPTHIYIRKLVLPMLPVEYISAVCHHLTDGAVTPKLEELVDYIRDQWTNTSNMSAFFQTTRTTDDLEGW